MCARARLEPDKLCVIRVDGTSSISLPHAGNRQRKALCSKTGFEVCFSCTWRFQRHGVHPDVLADGPHANTGRWSKYALDVLHEQTGNKKRGEQVNYTLLHTACFFTIRLSNSNNQSSTKKKTNTRKTNKHTNKRTNTETNTHTRTHTHTRTQTKSGLKEKQHEIGYLPSCGTSFVQIANAGLFTQWPVNLW